MLIDTHCHLNHDDLFPNRAEHITKAKNEGVGFILNVGYDIPNSKITQQIASEEDICYYSVGIHPHDANKYVSEDIISLTSMVNDKNKKLVAMGEMGLDYYRLPEGNENATIEKQKMLFMTQLDIAKSYNLPVVIHDRDSHEDIYQMIRYSGIKKGIMHCFSGNLDFANKMMELGFYISFAGPLTFPKNTDLHQTCKEIDLSRILIETDAPYLTPVPLRGKAINEPALVRYIADKVCEIRGITRDELGKHLQNNVHECFGVDIR